MVWHKTPFTDCTCPFYMICGLYKAVSVVMFKREILPAVYIHIVYIKYYINII